MNSMYNFRGGKGVKCYKLTEKTGEVVGVKAVNEENEIMLITTEGIIIRILVMIFLFLEELPPVLNLLI